MGIEDFFPIEVSITIVTMLKLDGYLNRNANGEVSCKQTLKCTAATDPGFSRRGAISCGGCANLSCRNFFTETALKQKEFGLGRASAVDPVHLFLSLSSETEFELKKLSSTVGHCR